MGDAPPYAPRASLLAGHAGRGRRMGLGSAEWLIDAVRVTSSGDSTHILAEALCPQGIESGLDGESRRRE